MLRGILFLFGSFCFHCTVIAQQPMIKSMEWGSKMKINLELSNDSSYILDVNQLPHSNTAPGKAPKSYTYYPARLSDEFINQLKHIEIESPDSAQNDGSHRKSDKTLWSAIHPYETSRYRLETQSCDKILQENSKMGLLCSR